MTGTTSQDLAHDVGHTAADTAHVGGAAPKKPIVPPIPAGIVASKVKTQLCRNYLAKGVCPYDDRCMFAHGESELRQSTASGLDETGDGFAPRTTGGWSTESTPRTAEHWTPYTSEDLFGNARRPPPNAICLENSAHLPPGLEAPFAEYCNGCAYCAACPHCTTQDSQVSAATHATGEDAVDDEVTSVGVHPSWYGFGNVKAAGSAAALPPTQSAYRHNPYSGTAPYTLVSEPPTS